MDWIDRKANKTEAAIDDDKSDVRTRSLALRHTIYLMYLNKTHIATTSHLPIDDQTDRKSLPLLIH